MVRPIYFALLILLFAAMGWYLVTNKPIKQAELQVLTPARVEVVQVRSEGVQPFDRISGRLQPVRKSSLRFEVMGNVVERLVEAGQRVGKDEPLLRLDDADYRDVLEEAEAKLKQEQGALKRDRQLLALTIQNEQLAQDELQRIKRLGRDSLASRSKRDEVHQRLLQVQSEQARLQYSVDSGAQRIAMLSSNRDRARRNLERTRMLAPYEGRINRVLVEVGDHVTSNRVVLELIEDEWLDLYAEVSATTAAALTAGQRLAVSVGETEHEGELVALQPDPDPDTFTYPLRVRLRGEGLLSGMLASVHLPLAPKVDALVVPLSAMLHEEGKSYVFVVKDKRLERRSVITGVRADGVQVVRAGLVLDETLVARDVASLSHGQDVLLIQPEQASLQ